MIGKTFFILAAFYFGKVFAGYDPNAKNNVAVYWGQGAAQKSLGDYCRSGIMDIVILSFINVVTPTNIGFNFGNSCFGAECPLIAEDIKVCQSIGIKVFLSMGGDSSMGNFNLENDAGGESAAQLLYEMFNINSKSSVIKPFGSDVQIDGFDLDVENGRQEGQVALVNKLKDLWGGNNLIVSACPQCPHPDQNVGLAIDAGVIDMVFMQFYSNPLCSMNQSPTAFTDSFNTWMGVCDTVLSNHQKQIKFFVTLQVAETNEWHATLSYITQQMLDKKSSKYFAGFGCWDVSVGLVYDDSSLGTNYGYLEGIKLIVSGVFDSQFSKRDEL